MKRVLILMAMFAVLVASPSFGAVELVVNGDFEAGSTGWTTSGGFTGISTGQNHTPSGQYSAYFGAVGGSGFVYQTQDLATSADTTYELKFWLKSDGLTPNYFRASFDGAYVFNQTISAQGWTLYSFHVTATSDYTTLAFSGRNDPGFHYLDDVSVKDVAAVPEPSTLLLLGSGLLGIVAIGRKKII